MYKNMQNFTLNLYVENGQFMNHKYQEYKNVKHKEETTFFQWLNFLKKSLKM